MRYHQRATTNGHIRSLIQESPASYRSLARQFHLNVKTVMKWRHRGEIEDHSTRPKTIHRSLTKLEKRIIAKVRTHLKLSLDDLVTTLHSYLPEINRMNCYRALVEHQLQRLPKELVGRGQFGTYLPGFFHVDTAYMPQLPGYRSRRYLFVGIDRVTKLVCLLITRTKSARESTRFLSLLFRFVPYEIHRILTE